MATTNQHLLPKKRTKSLIEWLDKISTFKLILGGLGLYVFVVLIFSVAEYAVQNETNFINNAAPDNFEDFVYFNFITILTIGYGDYSPSGSFKIFAITESILGLGIFSVFVSFLTIKSLLPRTNTVVFSKYGYYSLKENKFMVIYLNTANDYLINSETCSYVKTGGDWKVKQAVKAPFITNSVQTFFLDEVNLDMLKQNITDYDCLRVGISGNIGIASYSTSIEYSFKKILVINNRESLSNYSGFWNVDTVLGTPDFETHFHYNPKDSKTLFEYLRS